MAVKNVYDPSLPLQGHASSVFQFVSDSFVTLLDCLQAPLSLVILKPSGVGLPFPSQGIYGGIELTQEAMSADVNAHATAAACLA